MKKVCEWCGDEFETIYSAQKYCNKVHYMVCPACGESYPVKENTQLSKPPKACSRKCAAILRKQNNGGISPGHTSIAIEKRNTSQKIEKICELCGETFLGTAQSKYCNRQHTRPCPVCGNPVPVKPGTESNPPKCCSIECSIKLRKQTCQGRYGVDVASQADSVKAKLSDAAARSDVVSQRKLTNISRWGTENPSQNIEIRRKISDTLRSKPCQSQMRNTTKSRYGVSFAMQSPEVAQKYSDTIMDKYGVPYYCMTDDCKNAQGNIVSKINRSIGKKLSEAGLEYEFEFRLSDRSYDLHILDTNILLEINPTYTHNSLGNHWSTNGLPFNYHLDKTNIATREGYRCIHIFDWDDVDKVINMLKSKISIYGRQCDLVTLQPTYISEFLNSNHLQGSCRGQKVCLGLIHNGDLIQVMTFGKPRYNRKYEWELLRLCTDSKFAVIGGANKLLKYFIHNYTPQNIISYCDVAKFTGTVYTSLGFNCIRTTEPQKVWSKGKNKLTDNLLRQRGYDQLFNTQYGKGANNEELMIQNGWLPVYDCGQKVFEWAKEMIS